MLWTQPCVHFLLAIGEVSYCFICSSYCLIVSPPLKFVDKEDSNGERNGMISKESGSSHSHIYISAADGDFYDLGNAALSSSRAGADEVLRGD